MIMIIMAIGGIMLLCFIVCVFSLIISSITHRKPLIQGRYVPWILVCSFLIFVIGVFAQMKKEQIERNQAEIEMAEEENDEYSNEPISQEELDRMQREHDEREARIAQRKAEEEQKRLEEEQQRQAEEAQGKAEEERQKEEQKTTFTYAGMTVKFIEYKIEKNAADQDCLVLYFDFTNNSGENQAFLYAFDVQAFQNGIELDDSYMHVNEETRNHGREIQNGTTVRVADAFVISEDRSDVKIEVTPYIDFTGKKLFEKTISFN